LAVPEPTGPTPEEKKAAAAEAAVRDLPLVRPF
jgi:hypothetical protein